MATPLEGDGPFSFNEVYLEELRALRPGLFDGLDAEGFGDDSKEADGRRAANLRALYDAADKGLDAADEGSRPLSALCFSGGGIRSATFNLGVLQALARAGLLERFDYISSVSGGGYISGWLAAWRRRSSDDEVFRALAEEKPPANPHAPEPVPLDKLREYSNFLTPRTGTLSVDLWTAVAIVLRNLLLNWLVLLPVLAGLIAVPQLCLLVVQGMPGARPPAWLWVPLGLAIGLVGNVASFWIRTARLRQVSEDEDGPSAAHLSLVAWVLVPLWVSSLITAAAAIWGAGSEEGAGAVIPYALILFFASPLLGWAVAGLRFAPLADTYRPFLPELVALLVSGAVASLLLVVLYRAGIAWLAGHPAIFVAVGLPAVLATHLVGTALFVGLSSAGERRRLPRTPPGTVRPSGLAEMDREWWARHSGWVLIAGLTWLVTSLLVLAAAPVVLALKGGIAAWVAAAGGVSGAVVTLLAMSGKTSSGRRDDAAGSKSGELGLRLAVPVFCVSVAILLALGMAKLGRALTGDSAVLAIPRNFAGKLDVIPLRSIGIFAGLMAGLLLLGAVAAWAVNVNRFSLQALYRNRLVRAYLGASNPARRPDPFTGFDPRDDFPLHECRNERPLPVLSGALNLVRGAEHLAWQQRKAESFSMSPFFCGNFHDGYRKSTDYAGGLRLGSAMAISGAAANPNMGYHSSPAVTFLLTLFNARLGAWLGNPGRAGNGTFRYPGPVWALRPILAELFGHTDSESRYVNLSDGGHFENLGMYEMVLRRCRYLVVSDAGQDPRASFDDLGNAIRKIRIDFRISIDFEERIHIAPREDLPTGLYCARARIRYSEVDGEGARDGILLYVKPALYGGKKPVPYDVWAYAGASPLFPHEPTADQWFDESQFESYRALGLHVMGQIGQSFTRGGDLPEFFAAADSYLRWRDPETQGGA